MHTRRFPLSLSLALALAACGGKTEDAPQGSAGSGGTGASGGETAGCTVQAAGSLPESVAEAAVLSGPGIVATDTGFVLGYREQHGDNLRAAMLALSDAGETGTPSYFDLDGCASKTPHDGVSLAYRAGGGLLVTSLPDCGKGAGAMFLPFDDNGSPSQGAGPRNQVFTHVGMSARSVAPSLDSGEWELVYAVTADDAPPMLVERLLLQGAAFKVDAAVAHPFGDVSRAWASVASSADVIGMLAADGAGALDLMLGPNAGNVLKLVQVPAVSPAKGGDLVAYGPRVAVAARTGVAVHLRVLELLATGLADVVATGELPIVGALSVALGVDDDRLFAATGHPGSIQLDWLTGAKSNPNFAAASTAQLGAPIPALASFDGSHLALAAARGRVALVWLSSGKLTQGQPTGGWLLASCH